MPAADRGLHKEAGMRMKPALTRGGLASADMAGEPETRGSCTSSAGTRSGSIGGFDQDICSAITTP
jgi:hypothetical protein